MKFHFIGFIGLLTSNMDIDFQEAVEIGWQLDHHFWKRGYAVEGATACLNDSFQEVQLPEVYSFTAVLNNNLQNEENRNDESKRIESSETPKR